MVATEKHMEVGGYRGTALEISGADLALGVGKAEATENSSY
jgi:hypothetical protein